MIRLVQIARYPVKGLTAQTLDAVALEAGKPLPNDRRFALAHGRSAYDPKAPAWQKKAHFLNWARNPALAGFACAWSSDGTVATVQGRSHDLTTAAGRDAFCQAALAFVGAEMGPLILAEAPNVAFADVNEPLVSIQNEATFDDLTEKMGAAVDPRRMRGNLLLDGAEPWAEMQWPGRKLTIGGAVLEVVDAIGRCPATLVNPDRGGRDLDVLAGLERHYGHQDCGVYARVIQGGRIAVGDRVSVA